MKQTIFLFTINLVLADDTAQPGKKPVQLQSTSSQPGNNKMMENTMKDLSPGQKQVMQDVMKNNKPTPDTGSNQLIPAKQTEILAKISKLTNETQYYAFIKKMHLPAEKNIDAPNIATVKKPVADNKGRWAQLLEPEGNEYKGISMAAVQYKVLQSTNKKRAIQMEMDFAKGTFNQPKYLFK